VIYSENTSDQVLTNKVTAFAKKAWVVFAAGTVLATAPLGWDRLVHPSELLHPGQTQRALPPGSSDTADACEAAVDSH
jgi:hypothetical protein